jgi:hypothetical protein
MVKAERFLLRLEQQLMHFANSQLCSALGYMYALVECQTGILKTNYQIYPIW